MAEQFSKEAVDLIAKRSEENGYHVGYAAGYEQCKKDMIALLEKEAGKALVEYWDGGVL